MGANLLSQKKTLELYKSNAAKTNDPVLMLELAVFMVDASKSLENACKPTDRNFNIEAEVEKASLQKDAIILLKKLADRGHVDSQYYLADCYSNGIGVLKGRQDFDKAFPFFVLAAKHGHGEAAYRAATCFENGWGCRRDAAKAVSFYRSYLSFDRLFQR